MKRKVQWFLINFMILLLIVLLPFVFTPRGILRLPDFEHNPHERTMLIDYFLIAFFFLFNYYVLIPRLYLKRHYLIYFFTCAGFVIFFTFFEELWIHFFVGSPVHPPQTPFPGRRHGPPPTFLHGTITFLFSVMGIAVGILLRSRRYIAQIESEKSEAEISFLKSQINPHFLFNTLNSVYALSVREKAADTSRGILSVSNLMRYVVTDATKDFIDLQREIEYIRDFIELQKLRLDKGIHINFELKGNTAHKKIAPLLLIPFIENAFKYGVSPDENAPITIRLSIYAQDLYLYVQNHILSVQQQYSESSGIGVSNTRNRLEILYPSEHELDIQNNGIEYIVQLKIRLL